MNKRNIADKKGKEKEHSRQKRPPKKITESYLHNAGLYYLERFAASSGHFRSVMMRKITRSCMHHKDQDKEACAVMLDKTIEKFQNVGLLDDAAYCRAMVHSMRRRGHSARMIHAKLRAKSLSQDIINKALGHYAAENNDDNAAESELMAALRLSRRKRIGPFARTPTHDDHGKPCTKQMGQLARAGFGYDICRKIMDMRDEELETYQID